VRTVEMLDGLYGHTRFSGLRKANRAGELFRRHVEGEKIVASLS